MQIGGTQLHYIQQGKGQSVIFVHGAINDYRSWQFQIEPFSRKYCTISYSRRFAYPNMSTGDARKDNTIEGSASDLAELIRKLDLAPAFVVGHSSGAFAALYCAYKNPDLIKSLVLGEPPVLPLLEKSHLESDVKLLQEFRDNARKPAEEAFDRGEDERAVRIFLDGVMGKRNFFDLIPAQVRQIIMDNAKSLQGEIEKGMPSSFSINDVKKISTPSLLVKGEFSARFLLRITEILSENMPNSEQATIPGVTHDLGRMTKAEIFNTKVMEFLAKHG
jgi:pimeloyl-ACP methyl ester carboxylesterase